MAASNAKLDVLQNNDSNHAAAVSGESAGSVLVVCHAALLTFQLYSRRHFVPPRHRVLNT